MEDNPRQYTCAGFLFSVGHLLPDDTDLFDNWQEELKEIREDKSDPLYIYDVFETATMGDSPDSEKLKLFHQETGNKFHFVPVYIDRDLGELKLTPKGEGMSFVYIISIDTVKTKGGAFKIINRELDDYNYYLNN